MRARPSGWLLAPRPATTGSEIILLLYVYLAALALLLRVWVEQRRRMGGEPPAVGEGAEAS